MRHAAGIAALALVALAIVGAPAATAAPTEPLGHVGRWITDSHGRAVIFHGVAIVPASEMTTPESAGVSDDDAQWLADHGFDLVRLGGSTEAGRSRPTPSTPATSTRSNGRSSCLPATASSA